MDIEKDDADKKTTLSFKLLIATGLMLLFSILVLNGIVNLFFQRTVQQVTVDTTRVLSEEVRARLNSQAGETGARLAGFINENFVIPLTLASTLGSSMALSILISPPDKRLRGVLTDDQDQ